MKRKHNTYLADNDKYVPEGYISITDLFSDKKYTLPGYNPETWCLGYIKLQELRKKSFLEAKSRFEMSSVKMFGDFWNGNLDSFNSLGINKFSKIPCFKELSTVMICFDNMVLSSRKDNKNDYVSFGIKKELYEKFYLALKTAIENGEPIKYPSLNDLHKRRMKDVTYIPKITIKFPSDDPKHPYYVTLEKNELFLEFDRWCNSHMIKRRDAIYQAMRVLMRENPIENGENYKNILVNENTFYKNIQEVIYTSNSTERKYILATVPDNVRQTAKAIVRRYNSDPENIGKGNLTLAMYAGQAISNFNKTVPLKYSDPLAYEEYIKSKNSEEYNKK